MKSTYKLGDIASISAGQGAPQKESDFSNIGKPFIRAGSLAKLVEGYSENNICELIDDDTAKKYGLRLYPKDTIVFAKSGMSTSKGYVHILSQECYIVNHLACINIYNNDSSYMKYYFMYHRPNKLIKDEAYPSISLSDIRDMKINIHNIQTQKEIVAVLDKVTSLISKRKKQLEKLDILVKSKFIEMFGDPVLNPKGWEKKKLGEVYTIISGTTPDTNEQKYWNGTNLWVTPAELNNEIYINTTARKITDEAIKAKSLKVIPKFSVLLSSRAPIGKLAINTADLYCNQGFKCFINSKVLHSIYTYFYLLHRVEYIQSLGRGATFKEVSKEIVANIEIQVPPLELQNQFAKFVEQVEKNKENIKSSLNQLETLYSALMQEYFG